MWSKNWLRVCWEEFMASWKEDGPLGQRAVLSPISPTGLASQATSQEYWSCWVSHCVISCLKGLLRDVTRSPSVSKNNPLVTAWAGAEKMVGSKCGSLASILPSGQEATALPLIMSNWELALLVTFPLLVLACSSRVNVDNPYFCAILLSSLFLCARILR